jgi:hypothetical protein
MIFHLEEAEALTRQIDKWETWAQEKAKARVRRNEELFLLKVKELLQGYQKYKNLASRRTTHMQLAQAYGIAALVEQGHHGQNPSPGTRATLPRPDDHRSGS